MNKLEYATVKSKIIFISFFEWQDNITTITPIINNVIVIVFDDIICIVFTLK